MEGGKKDKTGKPPKTSTNPSGYSRSTRKNTASGKDRGAAINSVLIGKRKSEEHDNLSFQPQPKMPTLTSVTTDSQTPLTIPVLPVQTPANPFQKTSTENSEQIITQDPVNQPHPTKQARNLIHAISEESLIIESSQPEGVLSESDSQVAVLSRSSSQMSISSLISQIPALPSGTEELEPQDESPKTPPEHTDPPKKATVDLTLPEIVDSLPPTALTVHIRGGDGDTALRIFNPISVARIITSVCGEVGDIKHLRSGGLLVRCVSQEQVRKLLSISSIPSPKPNSPLIPIITSLAISGNTSSGKIYAPWLRGIPLYELLEELRPLGVIQIRKLLNDRTRSHVSLFVLVFLHHHPQRCQSRI